MTPSHLAAALLALSVIAATPSGSFGQATRAGQPSESDASAFRSLLERHATAMNRRDADGVAATFTRDADQVFFDAPQLHGRDAIRAALQPALSAWPASQRFHLVMTSARMIAPNVALVETNATFSDATTPPNRGTLVVVRDEGEWRIAALRVYPAVKTP